MDDTGDKFERLPFSMKDRFERARLDGLDRDPFREFASGDWLRVRRMLAHFGDVDLRLSPFIADEGLTLLHLSARFGLREATATLLGWGVHVDAMAWPRNVAGASWRALTAGLAVDLVGAGERGAFGLTPLHLAVLADDAAMIRYLLAMGANPRRAVYLDGGVEGDWRWTTIDLASRVAGADGENAAIVALLRDAETRAEEPPENWWLRGG